MSTCNLMCNKQLHTVMACGFHGNMTHNSDLWLSAILLIMDAVYAKFHMIVMDNYMHNRKSTHRSHKYITGPTHFRFCSFHINCICVFQECISFFIAIHMCLGMQQIYAVNAWNTNIYNKNAELCFLLVEAICLPLNPSCIFSPLRMIKKVGKKLHSLLPEAQSIL